MSRAAAPGAAAGPLLRRVAVVAPTFPPDRCGVGDHTGMLSTALAAAGASVEIFTMRGVERPALPDGVRVYPIVPDWSVASMMQIGARIAQDQPAIVLIQYVPFLYARHGISFAAPVLAWYLRCHGVGVITIVHEPYVPLWRGIKSFVRGLAQRVMLVMLMLASARVAVTTRFWERELRRWMPWRGQRIARIPVGSNIPLSPISTTERSALRARLGLAQDDLVLTFFGSLHGTKLLGLIARSVAHLQSLGLPAVLLIVGQEAEVLSSVAAEAGLIPGTVICTGYSSVKDVSRYLQCGDLFLAPFTDGVSTRRTTVIAALQHRLPVVTTSGRLTEEGLFANAVAMVPCGDEDAFVRRVAELARDPDDRCAVAERGYSLYERTFTWPAIVTQLDNLLSGIRIRSRVTVR